MPITREEQLERIGLDKSPPTEKTIYKKTINLKIVPFVSYKLGFRGIPISSSPKLESATFSMKINGIPLAHTNEIVTGHVEKVFAISDKTLSITNGTFDISITTNNPSLSLGKLSIIAYDTQSKKTYELGWRS